MSAQAAHHANPIIVDTGGSNFSSLLQHPSCPNPSCRISLSTADDITLHLSDPSFGCGTWLHSINPGQYPGHVSNISGDDDEDGEENCQ